ncbi:MAG TPA: hypothetical protein VMY42_20005 [Thermoguttaceae bacterium]|nr:hypothetical protein [Thermoguttaceae bacterium]
MVNFQQSRPPRNYLARREQVRLLLLVVVLGLVVFAVNEARKEKNWAWLFGEEAKQQEAPPQHAPKSAETPRFDNRPKSAEADDQAPLAADDQAPLGEDPSGRFLPGVDPKLLEAVQDNSPVFNSEQPARFNLLDVLNRTDEATLRQKSPGRVTYAQLFSQSKEYRGELVTVRGTVRRAVPLPLKENDYGIEGYYEVWLFPDDNPKEPIVVQCLYLPDRFPTGMEMAEAAEVDAIYFKRWVSKAEGLPLVPLMLARTVRWQIPVQEPPTTWSPLWMIVVAGLVGLVLAALVFARTRPKRPRPEEVQPDFQALRNVDHLSHAGLSLEEPLDREPTE